MKIEGANDIPAPRDRVWKAFLDPVATMGNQTRTRNNVICKTESVTANRAQTLVRAAMPAAMKAQPVKYAQNR